MTQIKSPTFSDAPSASPTTEATEMVAMVRPSIVQVRSAGRGNGTGVIWSSTTILTNEHVVAHAHGPLQIVLTDGRSFAATVGARSADLDLAVLHVQADRLPAAAVGDSTQLRIGELVFAIGHPWGQPWVVTSGIVSGLGEVQVGEQRTAPYIRSDVRLAPGNSGGPLLNARGEVIGINAMIFGGDLAVAIPSHVATRWLSATPDRPNGVTLGVQIQPVTLNQGQHGLLVIGLEAKSTAARAGLMVGDVLLEANGSTLGQAMTLRDLLLAGPESLHLSLLRAGAITSIDVQFVHD